MSLFSHTWLSHNLNNGISRNQIGPDNNPTPDTKTSTLSCRFVYLHMSVPLYNFWFFLPLWEYILRYSQHFRFVYASGSIDKFRGSLPSTLSLAAWNVLPALAQSRHHSRPKSGQCRALTTHSTQHTHTDSVPSGKDTGLACSYSGFVRVSFNLVQILPISYP